MDWIFDHFQIVVLIAVVIGSLVKRFLEAKAAEKEARERMDEGDIFDPGEDWEPQQPEQRPFVPPPLVRTTPPPLVLETPHPHSREHEADVILKRQQDMQERIRLIKESKANTTGGAAATNARVSAAQSRAKPIKAAKASLRGDLRNPKELRRAIVMREILGPPVGLL